MVQNHNSYFFFVVQYCNIILKCNSSCKFIIYHQFLDWKILPEIYANFVFKKLSKFFLYQNLLISNSPHSKFTTCQKLLVLNSIHSNIQIVLIPKHPLIKLSSFQFLIIPNSLHTKLSWYQNLVIPNSPHCKLSSYQKLLIPNSPHSKYQNLLKQNSTLSKFS